jgi:hypothetical protein
MGPAAKRKGVGMKTLKLAGAAIALALSVQALADSCAARAASPAERRQAVPGPGAAAGAATITDSLGTGHGRSETSHARYVDFERATEQPAETIAIHYDSHQNLVAMGVIRERGWHPQPFPGFVPDPVGALPAVTPSSGA